ncbi:anhydro-N-acetylmuramic acid kinase AnmK [Risungbinella massiliensis]|uniref:anhydro-N-acetylmuramic acid kinase AnmK n=1 Tax=Risungbinella massiliensis TaxID=1329796 RepID=UPI0005CBD9BF|nr:anhydro-N-acetylmuramic acid kinase AnmK [Risungbinella massiliensis]
MYVIGLMSGTSLDGVDAALVEITGSGKETKLQTIGFQTYPLPSALRDKIVQAISPTNSTSPQLNSLNFELGYWFADAVKQLCHDLNFPLEKVDLIGSHGQTIYHQPFPEADMIPSTLQLGEPSIIAYETGVCVISNFRTMDMAAGGQGAPLVPYTEYLLYRHPIKSRLLQNIGGIGNVTVLRANTSLDEITAFDTGPGNMIIDEVTSQLFATSYDPGGQFAATGTVKAEIVEYGMSHPFIKQVPPKSTGREVFGYQWTTELISRFVHHTKEDILASVTMLTAQSIADNYREFIFPTLSIDEVILGGGGSYNKTLVKMIRDLLQHDCHVWIQEDLGFSSSAKEAIAFAVLANETIHGNPSNAPKATGAKEHVILGNITTPYPLSIATLIQQRQK